ncbi:MAG: hydroxymethylglutaryl-CoA lyase [Actinobacteria bacterium]|nr:hydroxymethylglutaryl-CoA lyase [Actinomycetota bacterium]
MDAPTESVTIVEVAPRDGLQNDPALLSTEAKLELIERCAAAGAQRIEVASFVNPRRVPQMADAEQVIAGLPQRADTSYIGLVLNERGFQRAEQTALQEINMVVMVTDEFSQRNQGMSTREAIAAVAAITPAAKAAGLHTSVTMSASFGCPYTGEVPVGRVADIAAELAATGVAEVAIADTIGVAVPRDVHTRVAAVRAAVAGTPATLRVHVHNTRNTGYASALAAYEAGVTVLDSSLGGIGGCPFAPNATGNIATEDLVFALERSGVHTGLDLDALCRASEWLAGVLGRPVPSLLPKAGGFPPA